jgi:3-oxoacyl-[acyl-carrier-protein] synthase-3
LAEALIDSGQASKVLLVTADTYSKLLKESDKNVRTLFGDGATATLLVKTPGDAPSDLGPFVYGTDGEGGKNLCCARGGLRSSTQEEEWLFMNGPEVFNFTLRVVPNSIHSLLERARLTLEDIDLFVFHQANAYMLEHLRKKIGVPKEKFVLSMRQTGNTVSSTIPFALQQAQAENKLKPGAKIVLAGFGVGYSWASTLLKWRQC